MQQQSSKNNKVILVSLGNKQNSKRADVQNTSQKRVQSNEKRLQTLEPESTNHTNNHIFSKQLFQSPANNMGSNQQKRKLFSNLNNCTPKSPASIYATIQGPNTTTAASGGTNSFNSRHSKIAKLNNFFEQRKNNGVESAKKNKITNENMIDTISRQKYQIMTEMEEENSNPHSHVLQNHNFQNISIPSNQNYEQMNRIDNNEYEFNKTSKEFRKQVKQNQMNQLSQHSQQQKINFPHVPDSILQNSTPNSQNHESQETNNKGVPLDKQASHIQQNTGLNQFITRINKGELMGGLRQSYNNSGNTNNSSNYNNISNNLNINSPNSNFSNNQFNHISQNQINQSNQQQQQSSLVPINNQTSNSNQIMNMTKLFSSNENKTNKEVVFTMNNKFKKAESFKVSRTNKDLSPSSSPSNNMNEGSIRSSLQKPFSKKSGRQTISSVRTTSSMKSKSKKSTPLQISLDHSLNQQTQSSNQNQQIQNQRQSALQTSVETTAIEIEEPINTPQEIIVAQPNQININFEDVQLNKQKNTIKHTHYYNIPMANALKNKVNTNLYFDQIFKEHFIQSFHSLNFCKAIKPVPHHVLQQKKTNLPIHQHNQGKKTIVFDLDETLIHCNESTELPADVIIPIKFPNNDIIDAGINVRPHAKECLEELSKHFEIIVFTASHGCYAMKVLQHLDPQEKLISHKLFRESCVQTEEGVHIKDMRIFQNRNIKDIVLVDNAAYSFGFQIENGIPIIPYYDNKNDQELKYLTQFLIQNILDCNDVRDVIKHYFKMHLHQASEKLEHAAKKMYNV